MSDMNIQEQPVYLEEYKSLREETVKRVELNYQIINLTLIATGALWTVGTASTDIVLLLHPWLVFFFAANYGSNNYVIVELGVYTREWIEKGKELCWASYFATRVEAVKRFHNLSIFGIFAGTSALSLVIYYLIKKAAPDKSNFSYWLFVSGIIATISTILLLRYTLNHNPKNVLDTVKKIRGQKNDIP